MSFAQNNSKIVYVSRYMLKNSTFPKQKAEEKKTINRPKKKLWIVHVLGGQSSDILGPGGTCHHSGPVRSKETEEFKRS